MMLLVFYRAYRNCIAGGKSSELRMVFDHLNQPPIATKEKLGNGVS
jgi:hypothetical protein